MKAEDKNLNNQYGNHGDNGNISRIGILPVDIFNWRIGANVPKYEVKVRRNICTVPEYSFEKRS